MLLRRLILVLFLACAAARADDRAGSLETLSAWMEDFLARENISGGALAVTQGGRLIFAQGYGLANRATGENFQPDTLTRIGSLSKFLTATTLLRHGEKTGLDNRARMFGPGGLLPEPIPDGADPRLGDVRLEHFFTMSSGWSAEADASGPFAALAVLAKTERPLPASASLVTAAMLGRPLAAAPGTTYEYLNISPIFLAEVLQNRTGKSYEAAVRDLVLDPLGLRAPRVGQTRAADRQLGEAVYESTLPEFASLYPGDGLVPLAYCYGLLDLPLIAPTGGWVFSAVDFALFFSHAAGERRPELVSAAARKDFTTKPDGVQTWTDTARFYGFHTEAFADGAVWGKYGSMPGVAAWAAHLPGDLGVVIVLNGRNAESPEVYDPPFAGTRFDEEIRDGILSALRDLPRVPGDLFRSRYAPNRPALFGTARVTGTVGEPFSHTLTAAPKNVLFSTAASIPGLRLNPTTGELRGAPRQAGRFLLPVTAGNLQGSTTAVLEVLIGEAGSPVVSGQGACPPRFQNVLRDGRWVDEVLMQGADLTVQPRPGRGARVHFLDRDGDLVVAELEGPGRLQITLANAMTRPSANYPARGDAEIVLLDTTAESTFRLFPVGKLNGGYPATGDAVATVHRLRAEASAVGQLALGNAAFRALDGVAGVTAPNTAVDTVIVGELAADGPAVPTLRFARTGQVVFAGAKLLQPNGQPVQVSGISAVDTSFGADANGFVTAPQRPQARFIDNGVDITDKLFPPETP
jgi:CubicO group peptidase (beta-lactamase class C family)